MLLLTTRGRRTGLPRTVALAYAELDGALHLVGGDHGSDRDPGWVENLRAEPEAVVELGRRRLAARAALLGDAERAVLWPRLAERLPAIDLYRARAGRPIPVVRLALRPWDVVLRGERPDDADAIDAVHRTAFPTDDEARLVRLLRAAGRARVSLVAERDGRVVGHVLLSPVTVDPASDPRALGLGLAPLAVLPAEQRRGVGAALVQAGLEACRALGARFVVVLGDPGYYGRFGFRRAADAGLHGDYDAPDAFQARALVPDGLPRPGSRVRYAPEFASLAG